MAQNNIVIKKEPGNSGKVLGILSIIFSSLTGWVGLVLGIIGVCISKRKSDKILNIVGMSIFGLWIIFIIIVCVVATIGTPSY